MVLDGLSIELSGKTILSDISLQISPGDRVAIIGKSGAGKSTLLGAMVGIPAPTAGKSVLLGCDLSNAPKKEIRSARRKTGHISQGFDLVDEISALENVLLGEFAAYRVPRVWAWTYSKKTRGKALALIEKLGMADQVLQRAGTMSGGERQRVAIARSLMSSPAILFADEPVSALDENSSRLVMADLHRVSEAGVAVVAALHQLDLALQWATHVVFLSKGRAVQVGQVKDFNSATLKLLMSEE